MLWSVGRFDLGLTDSEFWDLTPVEFDALTKRHEAYEDMWNRRFALMPYIYASANADPKKTRPKLEDFLFSRKRKQTVKDMQRVLIDLNAAFGGEITET
jgi:hypothetical protein